MEIAREASNGSAVKSSRSYRGPECHSQHPRGGGQLSMTPVPGDLSPSSGLHRLQAYLLCTNDHALSLGVHIVSYTHADGLDLAPCGHVVTVKPHPPALYPALTPELPRAAREGNRQQVAGRQQKGVGFSDPSREK